MVKGVAKSTNAQSSTSTPQRLPAMQAGQDFSDPLTQLNSHMAQGHLPGFNPFANMGLNLNDPNMASPTEFRSRRIGSHGSSGCQLLRFTPSPGTDDSGNVRPCCDRMGEPQLIHSLKQLINSVSSR